MRFLFTLFLILAFAAFGFAQEPPAPIVLKLVPAAEPALRIRLLPELRDQTHGNAVTAYYRAFSPEWQLNRNDQKLSAMVEAGIDAPLVKLRGEAQQWEWLRKSNMLREVDYAARRSYCDWEMNDRIREDGIMLLIPDIQELRRFARLLAMRARLEMADGDFAAAAKTFQTGFSLARHAGDGSTLIQGLVGIAIAQVMCHQLETWVQTPGSPNLYWSLTDLPSPFIDLRKCYQGERLFHDCLLPGLRERMNNPKMPPFSPQEMRDILEKLTKQAGLFGGDGSTLGFVIAAAKYPGAKKFLTERGFTTAQIEAMPILQAVLMQEIFELDRLYDRMTRGVHLPFAQGNAVMLANDDEQRKERAGSPAAQPVLARALLPAMDRVAVARARLDRQIAALRVVEAIRLYAATHPGRLPAAISDVPVPVDPFTGKPFDYTVTGEKAMIAGAMPPGVTPNQMLRYEVMIAK